MLRIDDRLGSYVIAAGEPWIMSVQMKAMSGGAIIDWSTRRLVQTFYAANREQVAQIEGVYTSDATGAYFAFIRDGAFSEGLFGQSLQVELAERLLNGRNIIAAGSLSITPTAAGITTFGAIIGRVDARFSLYFDAVGLISLVEQDLLPYLPTIVAPPVTLGTLTTSGTLRVGTASNGSIVGATDGSTITESVAGFAVNADRTYTYDGTGSAGTIADALVETHPNAINSPRQSALTLAAAPITLTALSLAANSITENAASGTTVGGILGKTAGSTLSLANDDGGRFAISGTNLVAGLTNIDYEAAASRSIVLRETLTGATNSPRDTPLAVGVVNVNEQPSLRALLLSSTSLTIGTPATGTITEAATGSAIAASGLPAGFTVNGPARTWAYDGSGPASNSTITLTETLGDSPNSPRSTQIGVAVAAPAATPAAFTMTQLATPNRIYQRTAKTGGSGAGTGPISVNLNVTQAGTIYARTRSTVNGNPVLQAAWKAVDNAPVANGPVAIPGINARVEDFFLDLSPDGATWTNGTVPVGMGKLIAYHGQSLMEAMVTRRTAADTMAGAGETPTTAGRVLSEGGAWNAIVDDGGSNLSSAGFNALIRLQSAATGCRIGMVGYAQGATEIAFWTPGNTGWAKFIAAINAAGNRIETSIWMQGHSDSANILSADTYQIRLSQMYDALDGIVTDATYIRYLASIPNVSVTQWGPPYAKEAIRVAADRWCAEHPRAVSVTMDDLILEDGVHQKQVGAVQAAVNFHRYMVNPATAVGATFGTVTRSGAALSVPLILPAGATGYMIAGDLKARMAVFKRGLRADSHRLPISSVALGAVAGGAVPLNVTLQADPGDLELDIWLNPKNDPSADGSTIVLRNDAPGTGASYGRQVAPVRPMRYSMARPLVLNAATYAAGRWGSRQGLTGNSWANSPDTILNNWAEGFTVELWLRHPGATGTNVFMNCAGSWLAADGTDLSFNGTKIANVLPANQWLHVAYTIDAGSTYLHVDGKLVFGARPGADNPNNQQLGIRGFPDGGFRPNNSTTVSDVAVWRQWRYGYRDGPIPSGPYAGNEPFLDHLYMLDGNGADSVIRA